MRIAPRHTVEKLTNALQDMNKSAASEFTLTAHAHIRTRTLNAILSGAFMAGLRCGKFKLTGTDRGKSQRAAQESSSTENGPIAHAGGGIMHKCKMCSLTFKNRILTYLKSYSV